jgi:DNA polymerase elongation subunit (family B)
VKKRRVEWQSWDEDAGEIDDISITGLEAERSDVAPVTRHAQELFAETLRMDTSEAREWLFPRLRELAQSIESGEIDLTRVCKRGGLGQDLSEYGTTQRRAGPLYRGAKYANKHIEGVTIQRGDKPACVLVDKVRGKYPSTYDTHTAEDGDVVDAVSLPDPSMLPDEFIVDWGRHLQKVLISPMRPLLDTRFGHETWSNIRHQTQQSGIETFL